MQSPVKDYLYAEYIMQKSRLDEAQAEIKTAGRNINNLRYVPISSNKLLGGEMDPECLFLGPHACTLSALHL